MPAFSPATVMAVRVRVYAVRD